MRQMLEEVLLIEDRETRNQHLDTIIELIQKNIQARVDRIRLLNEACTVLHQAVDLNIRRMYDVMVESYQLRYDDPRCQELRERQIYFSELCTAFTLRMRELTTDGFQMIRERNRLRSFLNLLLRFKS